MTDLNQSRPLIEVNVTASDWKEAVQYGGDLLVKVGKAEPRYVQAMINNIEKLGPYIVIAPGVALPHARPEDGVNQKGLSIILLKEPVLFGDEQIKLVICLAATDNHSHIDLLQQVAEVIQHEERLKHIFQSANAEEIEALFRISV